jgi:hypothetical protein
MVFNVTFNNISVISWLSVLFVEETGVPRENHRPVQYIFYQTRKLYIYVLLKLIRVFVAEEIHVVQNFFGKHGRISYLTSYII